MRGRGLTRDAHLTSALLAALLLAITPACGEAPSEEPTRQENTDNTTDTSTRNRDGKSDSPAPEDTRPPDTTEPPPPIEDHLELFIFREMLTDCGTQTCAREARFAFRGETMLYVQFGYSSGTQTLMPEDFEELEVLVDTPETTQAMREGWQCTPRDPGESVQRRVSFQTRRWVDGERQTHLQDVTDCFYNGVDDQADAIIQLASMLRLRYYNVK